MAKMIDQLYSVMQGMEGRLGGGEGVEGIYGSITQQGMQRIFDCLHHSCGMGSHSTLVDVGAGLGRPLLHAQLQHNIAHAYGVESDTVKCSKAAAFLRQTLLELVKRGSLQQQPVRQPVITCALIEQILSLEPCTHAYSFWEGVPVSGKQAFGRLFAAARTMQGVAVVQRAFRGRDPVLAMEELGFGPLQLVKQLPVKMSGSGRSFTAYIFVRPSLRAQLLLRPAVAPSAAAAVARVAPAPGTPVKSAAAQQDVGELQVQCSAVKPPRHKQQAAPSPAAKTASGEPAAASTTQAAAGAAAAADSPSRPTAAAAAAAEEVEVVAETKAADQQQLGASQQSTGGEDTASQVSEGFPVQLLDAASQEGDTEAAAAGVGRRATQTRPPASKAAAAQGGDSCRRAVAPAARGSGRQQRKGHSKGGEVAGGGAAAASAVAEVEVVAAAAADVAGAGGQGLVRLVLEDSWEENSPSKRLLMAGRLVESPNKRLCSPLQGDSSRDSWASSSTYNLRPKRLPFSSRPSQG